MDIAGPISPLSKSNHRYFLTIIDQHTSFKITKFLKNKSDVYDKFLIQLKYMENLHERKVKKVITDGGGEFVNHQFKELANQSGFVHVVAPPYTPEHNGVAERENRTIIDKARCLLLMSNLPNKYWAEAINTATYLTNIILIPSKNNLSPFQLWTKNPPKIKKIRTFGCKVVFLIPKHKRIGKLAPVGETGLLLGLNNDSSYRILKLSDNKVYCSRHVIFFEKEFPSLKENLEPNLPLLISSWNDTEEEEFFECQEVAEEDENTVLEDPEIEQVESSDEDSESLENSLPPAARRIKVVGPRHPTLINSDISVPNILPYSRQPVALLTEKDPLTYNQAISSSSQKQWKEAIEKEIQSMLKLEVWDDPWVFKTKRNDSNQITEHKARLCAQGFSQTQGRDYSKTFAPTGRLNSLRTLISVAAAKGLKFEQLDIKSAFLNAPIEEDVYLTIPQGLDRDKRHVCLKLKKAIYGLKQAPLAWYCRLSTWLMKFGFKISKADSCVFYLEKPESIWLFLHVDDIGIFGKNLTEFKTAIEREFQTKMLGKADLMLGIKIIHQYDSITLTQSHYIDSLLDTYGMANCKPVATPLIPNIHLEPATESEKRVFQSLNVNYCSAVGSRSYLSTATRPDLSYSISAFEIGLKYQKDIQEPIVAYSDADWGNCRITRRSTTGYLIKINDNLVIWKTRKQPTVSLSSAEAEYKSLTDLTSEILWLRHFCKEINISEV
ncbi:hypothetical protein O181_023626 [Austropuccinia psidii MF-1]|uniref:Integrase catalytic domain-containing protein n=1 Tax=Austropuccinia psidii MF-1 TaxID=1389203 RepID=A0A9Q3GXU4_9BASI|nr:hypothetical protein [Austropuccinia psidii MF-1]